jgi:hypothetical protein
LLGGGPVKRSILLVMNKKNGMDKKEINSPKLTEHFLFWLCGLGGLLLAFLFAHYVYHVL